MVQNINQIEQDVRGASRKQPKNIPGKRQADIRCVFHGIVGDTGGHTKISYPLNDGGGIAQQRAQKV